MKLEKSITVDNMNQKLLDIKYVVRGPIVQRAFEIEEELKKGVQKPFKHMVPAFIGDCHALGQKPIKYIRQVVAAAACPELLSSPDLPQDVKDRAREVLADCPRGSVGAYSPPVGLYVVRESVAQFLTARDGVVSDPEDIFLGAGATDLIRGVLGMFVHQDDEGKPPAVMIPSPEYPLFSGTLSELGLKRADYHLYVEDNWALRRDELERCYREASKESHVRVLVIINPGNPTGQVLSVEEIKEIVKFAYEYNLFIIADEVYQENIITKPFHSFKKVMGMMGLPYSAMELASFITASKGWAVECGLRCGALELARLQPSVRAAFRTQRSLVQCPSVLGQAALHAVMRPPVPGSASYAAFTAQREEVQRQLRLRAAAAPPRLNRIPGYRCGDIHAAMFAYPSVELPAAALRAAKEMHLEPDEFYCLRLLEETGICVVPGTGFGQRKGSFHIRITILSTAEEFHYLMDNIEAFHRRFLQQYS